MIHISGFSLLVMAILVYFLGWFVTRHVRLLDEYHIPAPVTGGLLTSATIAITSQFIDFDIQWDLALRDQLLLIFFCTVGLNARLRLLISGGKTLPLLFCIIAVFLVIQNTVGLSMAMLIGDEPIHGLIAGSITMAGGHGTAISWGAFLESEGYTGATEFGLIAATMGLIMGGMLGGPVAHQLIKNYRLDPKDADMGIHSDPESIETRAITLCMHQVLKVVLVIGACIIAGKYINGIFRSYGIVMPDYLPVLFLGMFAANIADIMKFQFNDQFINLFGDISLELFIAMSLMSLKLTRLAETAGPVVIIVLTQAVVICLFAYYIMFRAAGRDYDASLVTAGFVGLGLGATPVGLANVSTLTHRYGPSPKAYLIVPLLGSVFTDTLNAVVLQGFLTLPIFQ
ncbi:sodium/glutamate symporter [Spongorhabdus nitratireducens]